jgi:hypothetical protein
VTAYEPGRRGNHEGSKPRLKKACRCRGGVSCDHPPRWFSRIVLDGKGKDIWGDSLADITRQKRELLRRQEDGDPLTDSRVKLAAFVETWISTTAARR